MKEAESSDVLAQQLDHIILGTYIIVIRPLKEQLLFTELLLCSRHLLGA